MRAAVSLKSRSPSTSSAFSPTYVTLNLGSHTFGHPGRVTHLHCLTGPILCALHASSFSSTSFNLLWSAHFVLPMPPIFFETRRFLEFLFFLPPRLVLLDRLIFFERERLILR
jgi:hypothetical protein